VEGRDLSGAVLGQKIDEPAGALMMGTGATAKFEDGREWRGFRTKKYTYAIFRANKKELLFDNINDPLQKNNLAEVPEFRSVLDQLKLEMQAEMDRIGDNFEPCSFYEKNCIENRIIIF
jgi:hypothetical protein